MTQHNSDSCHDWTSPSIETFTGRQFFPLDPRPDNIDPQDIAHALSLKCRYTGHCEYFYSVAQHCVLMSQFLQGRSERVKDHRWALMHDASEAYLPDVAGPIKKHIPGFCEIEDRVLEAIAIRFRLPSDMGNLVHRLDRDIFWCERKVLLKPVSWFEIAEPASEDILGIKIEPWSAGRAKHEWIEEFLRLFPDEERAFFDINL